MGKECNFLLQVARMIFDVKGLIDWIQIKNSVKWYWKCATSYCFNSHGNIPLRNENVVFLLTQTSWLWRGYSLHWHITFGCEHVVFIHLNFTSISIFHPFQFFIHYIVHPSFHSLLCFIHNYCSSMYTWQNILPHHDIFNAVCQWIFF